MANVESLSFKNFITNFKKSIDILKNLLYDVHHKGGDDIKNLLNIFFIIYIISFFISLYSIYTYFDIKLFHNLQGSKLKIKQKTEVQS